VKVYFIDGVFGLDKEVGKREKYGNKLMNLN
jgi:hypothetical protein